MKNIFIALLLFTCFISLAKSSRPATEMDISCRTVHGVEVELVNIVKVKNRFSVFFGNNKIEGYSCRLLVDKEPYMGIVKCHSEFNGPEIIIRSTNGSALDGELIYEKSELPLVCFDMIINHSF